MHFPSDQGILRLRFATLRMTAYFFDSLRTPPIRVVFFLPKRDLFLQMPDGPAVIQVVCHILGANKTQAASVGQLIK